jgi:8-oxo-dGTP pyrophosphatase MutT (NUDIX family)
MSAKPTAAQAAQADEHSFGVIPIQQKNNDTLFLLIKHRGGHWAFPKGHANVGETEVETALRELHEETGISEVTLDTSHVFEERYYKPRWREPKRIVVKAVRYFLGEVTNPRIRLQTSEVEAYRWVNYADARRLITYDASRGVLDEAARHLGIIDNQRSNQRSG